MSIFIEKVPPKKFKKVKGHKKLLNKSQKGMTKTAKSEWTLMFHIITNLFNKYVSARHWAGYCGELESQIRLFQSLGS